MMRQQNTSNETVRKVTSLIAATLPNVSTIEGVYQAELSEFGLDSFELMKLIILIESEFDIQFDTSDLLFENFSTIEKITLRIIATQQAS
ncbi:MULTISPECIES: acyl carrier protein [unclassified Paenibacillus]|uniref:acyl carrier protein n=1 Tax=unclassified Paenibacillus TaxID=185978 RepID=UPI000931080F|nr:MULTISPECIES: acyl carrier protein [unclassified Paenibacillus]